MGAIVISKIYLFILSVVPILTLKLGSNLDAENIRENDDCYFECQIRSNPWVYKVVWLHNVST